MIARRALPLLALAALARPARAASADLALSCDTTLAPALRRAASAYKARTGVHVFVFPTSPQLIVPQLERDIQNDIVVTQTGILQQTAQAGIIAAPVEARWQNPLVIAGRPGASLDGAFAFVDGDGPALLPRLGVRPARTLGAIDTDGVAFLLSSGRAEAGLLYMTDARAHEGLAVLRPVPAAAQPPPRYAAAVTKLAQRPNPQGFVTFLAGAEATSILTAAGLERLA